MAVFKSSKDFLEWAIGQVARLQRAALGYPIDEDKYAGLVNVKDSRERTRLTTTQIYEHSYLELVYKMSQAYVSEIGGINSFQIFKEVPEMENAYFISKDGKQRLEMIWMSQAKRPEMPSLVVPAMPQPQTQEKKGRFNIFKKKEQP